MLDSSTAGADGGFRRHGTRRRQVGMRGKENGKIIAELGFAMIVSTRNPAN